nr:hypothetical protein [Candidatus Baldrarchaeota archaeon]
MKKLFRSKKALSPVVAAIILIAVTVAVSIAVAAWMGALSFGFMGGSEQVKIVSVQFSGTNSTNKQITITLQNTGANDVVITSAKVGDTVIPSASITVSPDPTVEAGTSATVTFNYNWTAGQSYNVGVVTKAGNVFTYYATAPSSSS